jgi:cysteine desulfurase family protein (TIGR01976 family)
MTKPFDVQRYRSMFPALERRVDGRPSVYFDGPGGSQVPSRVIEAVGRYLARTNANCGGVFATGIESDRLLDEARRAAADLVGTSDPDTIVFGPNMTTLTLSLARALARTLKPGDEVLVTSLDHDANVTPWLQAARDAGATARTVAIRPQDCTLDLDDLRAKLSARTRLVAVGCASNAVGTINPVREITAMAHDAGARVFLDAVHYAPHALIDVEGWGCDFLACSAYKFFGPHVGILYGRRELLESLPVYKLRPSSDALPHRWETGTQCHEGIAGTLEAIEYLADLGRDHEGADRGGHRSGPGSARGPSETLTGPVGIRPMDPRADEVRPGDGRLDDAGREIAGKREGGQDDAKRSDERSRGGKSSGALSDGGRPGSERRAALRTAFAVIGAHERALAARALEMLSIVEGLRLYGITDLGRLGQRAPTFSFTRAGTSPVRMAEHLARQGIFVWSGNFYALPLTEALGVEPGGLLRAGLLHYNTAEEIEILRRALAGPVA